MLNFTKSAFRKYFEASLWVNLILFIIAGGYLGYTAKGGLGVIIGLILGGVIGMSINVMYGGLVATFLNIEKNIEIIANSNAMASVDNNVDRKNNEVPKKEAALSGDFLK